MTQTTEQRVFELIAKQAKVDVSQVHPDSTMASLNIPSLGAVELIFDVEDAFDIHFPDDDGSDFGNETAAHLVAVVEQVLAAQAGTTVEVTQ